MEIVIGPEVGVAYWTDNASKPTVLAEFEQVVTYLLRVLLLVEIQSSM